jgi:molybdenum cofactor guanylyltransferase
MKVLGAIIAGGKSMRMGGAEKAFLQLGGKSLIAYVRERLAAQVDRVVINANGDPSRFDAVVVSDILTDIQTPLIGLHAVLNYAKDFDAVLTVPSDGPFIPDDLRKRLGVGPAIAHSAGQDHYLTGLWPVSLFTQLEDALRDGMVRMQDWVKACGAVKVEWNIEPVDPFFNVNSPEDLMRAEIFLK